MEDIIIKSLDNGCFDVIVGDKSTDQLSFDEMLGVVAQLTVPETKRCLAWLKTKEQHEAWMVSLGNNKITDVEFIETVN